MTDIEAGTLHRARQRRRLGVAGAVTLALVLAAASVILTRAILYRSSVLPGVTVAGVELGGLERSDARARIEAVVAGRLEDPVTVRVGTESFTTRPSDLFALDARATERRAFAAARGSFWSQALAVGLPFPLDREVEPVLRVRTKGRAALAVELAGTMRRPHDARVELVGLEPVVHRARFGAAVDESRVVDLIRAAALAGRKNVTLELRSERPEVVTAEAERAAAEAEALLAAPIEITFDGESVGKLWPRRLAKAIDFGRRSGGYGVVLTDEPLARALAPMVAGETKKAVDATFDVSGTRVRVIPSQGGTQVAVRKAAAAIVAVAAPGGDGSRAVAITLAKQPADLTTREARALGIREQISTFTTEMGASSSNRIWNVQLLGRYLDGTILKPGQTFSFNAVMGPRTPERGFREGQMIFGGVLIPSIGGGVCQTATTIFNAAFEAGLPISQRKNHSFYISHYPLGRDATVAWGGPDLVFRNDLDHAILIKASGTTATFSVSFYGTDQGRRVASSTSEPTNYTSPQLQYAIDPTAAPGSVSTTAAGGSGFDVTVYRTVSENGTVLRKDKFFTRYTPENPTAVYGPGSTPPGPYFTLPTS
jgi:vancomycin resistance protein YoaR